MTVWPTQAEASNFFGNPRGKNPAHASPAWEVSNLVYITPPFRMTYDGKPITKIRCHKKVAGSLANILMAIWAAAKHDQAVVDSWGASIYGGCYNYRLTRSGAGLSMHAMGIAIDLDPARNLQGNSRPHFARVSEVVKCFKEAGWIWGGDWSGKSIDGMHFQAARVI